MKEYITGIQHLGIPTEDILKTITFYEALGFEKRFETTLLQETVEQKVCFLCLENIVIETYEEKQTTNKPGAIDHFAINVNDIEEVYKRIKELGYSSVEGEIKKLPFWEKGVKFFTIYGPNKEKVEFSQFL